MGSPEGEMAREGLTPSPRRGSSDFLTARCSAPRGEGAPRAPGALKELFSLALSLSFPLKDAGARQPPSPLLQHTPPPHPHPARLVHSWADTAASWP